MKVIIVIILLFAIDCFATNEARVPELTFVGKRIVNLGVIKEGNVVKRKIYFTNTGDSMLIVNKVAKSCNCTAVTLKELKTFPGDTNYMAVTVDTKGKVGISVIDIVMSTNARYREYVAKLIMEVKK